MGINTRNMKLLAFAIGASFAGVSGVLFSAFQGFVSPESFTLWESIVVLAMVVLGGIGHIPSVILGAVVLAVFPEILRSVAEPIQRALFGHVIVDVEVIRQLIYGLALILICCIALGVFGKGGVIKMPSKPLLDVTDVSKRFGEVQALDSVGLEVPHDSIVGLIGPNCAGKTTFFNVITG